MNILQLTPEQRQKIKSIKQQEREESLRTFVNTWDHKDVVIIDTETTGTNVHDDEIVQISATRYSNGRSVKCP